LDPTVHLVNPSTTAFGTAVITPRWLFVLAGATPPGFGDPTLVDETIEQVDLATFGPGDIVGIGIHTANARRGYEVGRAARERGAYVVFGGIHATLYPQEARDLGGAHAVVRGDGEAAWPRVLDDCRKGTPAEVYEGGRTVGGGFTPARWDLLPRDRYMWASVQTVRGCPKHCSFCSVWKTDGQVPRTTPVENVIGEVVALRRMGFRFIALADDNFYPVTLKDLEMAARRSDPAQLAQLQAMRAERFELMDRLAQLPDDLIFFTQITMEAAEDPEFLAAMKRARIAGALVGVESVTPEGLKSIYKDFNLAGDALAERLRTFRAHGIHVLGSFIFGLSSDRPETFDATLDLATQADLTFAQFVTLTPFPGTVDFARWEASIKGNEPKVTGIPITRHWLIEDALRPKLYTPHPTMSSDEIRERTQLVWDRFYSIRAIWKRSRCVSSVRARLAFVLISKLYRQMYAKTGISTDSARINRAARWARWLARPCRRLFAARPMPELVVPAASQRRAA
jgi:tRNA A37 methylthiotransferase MiaB